MQLRPVLSCSEWASLEKGIQSSVLQVELCTDSNVFEISRVSMEQMVILVFLDALGLR